MKKIKNFVKNIFKDTQMKEKSQTIDSVTQSLLEKIEDLKETGMTEQEAVDKTVLEFGTVEDFFDVPEELTKKEKRRKTINHYKNDLLFSGVGSIIIICSLLYLNLYFFPSILWFVIPAIAVLWWPLAILYNLLNKKENRKEDDNE